MRCCCSAASCSRPLGAALARCSPLLCAPRLPATAAAPLLAPAGRHAKASGCMISSDKLSGGTAPCNAQVGWSIQRSLTTLNVSFPGMRWSLSLDNREPGFCRYRAALAGWLPHAWLDLLSCCLGHTVPLSCVRCLFCSRVDSSLCSANFLGWPKSWTLPSTVHRLTACLSFLFKAVLAPKGPYDVPRARRKRCTPRWIYLLLLSMYSMIASACYLCILRPLDICTTSDTPLRVLIYSENVLAAQRWPASCHVRVSYLDVPIRPPPSSAAPLLIASSVTQHGRAIALDSTFLTSSMPLSGLEPPLPGCPGLPMLGCCNVCCLSLLRLLRVMCARSALDAHKPAPALGSGLRNPRSAPACLLITTKL